MRKNKKIMTKIGSFLLAEMLALTSVTGVSLKSMGSNLITIYAGEAVETGTCGENVTYTLDEEGTLIISGTGTIDEMAFYPRQDINKVIIKDGITSIGAFSFDKCSSLTSIEIPNSVTNIGRRAFEGCIGLTSIEIPSSVTNIDESAFEECSSLTSIKIPSSVTNIEESVFDGCSSLFSIDVDINNQYYSSEEGVLFNKDKTRLVRVPLCGKSNSYKIPDSVTSIGRGAFRGCTGLTSIEIPNSVTYIESCAFFGCSSLTSIEIPNSVTYIEWYAFYECSSLTDVKWPNSVTYIYGYTFYGCSSLASIEIPSSVTDIYGSAFDGCSSLESIRIPSSVTNIKGGIFEGCSNLASIDVDMNNRNYLSEEGVLFSKDKTILIRYPSCKKGNSYKIPDSVTSIEGAGFEGCSSLASIEISDSVTNIEYEAFMGCSSLGSIRIPDSVTNIGVRAFADCSSLTSIKIPDGVTNIEWETFEGCSSLASVEIPDSVTNIEYDAFMECSSLASIEIPGSVTYIGMSALGYCYGEAKYSIIRKDGFIIYGFSGTDAERYANENGFEFIPLTSLSSGDGVSVIAEPDILPEEAVLVTETLDTESEEYKEIGEKISEYIAKLLEEEKLDIRYYIYEIHVTDENDNIVQPTGKVKVKIPVPDEYTEGDIKVYRSEADGTFTDMNAETVGGNLVFETDHFSVYTVTSIDSDTEEVIKGDINGDGKIDIKDSALLKRNLAGWDVEINVDIADVNGDGDVTIKDSALIKRLLAGWDVAFAQ